MRNIEMLWMRIDETKENVARLDFIFKLIRISNSNNSNNEDVTKEWALRAEEMLDDIDKKYQELIKYFEKLHQIAVYKRNLNKGSRYN